MGLSTDGVSWLDHEGPRHVSAHGGRRDGGVWPCASKDFSAGGKQSVVSVQHTQTGARTPEGREGVVPSVRPSGAHIAEISPWPLLSVRG